MDEDRDELDGLDETNDELDATAGGLGSNYSPVGPNDPAYQYFVSEQPVVVDPIEQFDAAIWGEPASDVEYWLPQKYNGWCAPSSVAMIVAEFTGQPLQSVDGVVQRAIDYGWLSYNPNDPQGHPFDGWSGMTTFNTEALLESFGIPATTMTGSMADLATYLEYEHSVMVSVDSSEVWTGVEDPGRSDHMLVVTGIDAVNGIVYMNDPYLPDGAGRAVPYAVFESAWADSGYTMIVTNYVAPDTAATNASFGGDADESSPVIEADAALDGDGFELDLDLSSTCAILPITFSSRAWLGAPVLTL